MIKTKFAFAAEQVLTDRQTAAHSAINIVEGIAAASIPFFFPKLSFMAAFERTPEDPPLVNVVFRVLCNGQEVVTQPAVVRACPKRAGFEDGIGKSRVFNVPHNGIGRLWEPAA